MTDELLLSVIIPVYNMEHSIERAINSVLFQTFINFEVILIDDGSTDRSGIIGERIASENSRVKYVKQSNRGASAARNVGLEFAVGKYVVFMDADDYIAPAYYNNIFKKSPDAEIIITGITKVYEDGSMDKLALPQTGVLSKVEIFENFMEIQLTSGLLGFVSNKFVLRSVIEENNLRFNDQIALCEDLEFFTRCYSYCHQFHCVRECGNFYTVSEKESNVDYISLWGIFVKIQVMLRSAVFLNRKNEEMLIRYQSELKYAYFNELKVVSLSNVRKGYHQLHAVTWQKSKDHNRKMIKKLGEGRHFRLLTVYLLLRKQYINLRKEWS